MSRITARELVQRLEALGAVSDEPGKLTRTFLSPAMTRANRLVAQWMREAGMALREDVVGNLIGRWEGAGGTWAKKTVVLGSHLDTVRDAGKFDGALGVLLAIAAVDEVRRRGAKLPFAVEVVGFSEEEGVRFGSAYLGSKGYAGLLREEDLRLEDRAGISVREALDRHGGRRFRLPKAAHGPREVLGYLEAHIEQGPVLEAEALAVGVVSAIAGQTRGRLMFRGQAGHAGTTPMGLRRDALAAAAEMVSAVERIARARDGLVATVGTIAVAPGAPNVIPGEAVFSLDVRHARDATRKAALRELLAEARRIAARRRVAMTWTVTQENAAVSCDPRLTRLLEASVGSVQGRSVLLVSGAGHDAVVMAEMAPVAMLFVRCPDGLSHHPDEFASARDIGVALRVTVDWLERMAQEVRR